MKKEAKFDPPSVNIPPLFATSVKTVKKLWWSNTITWNHSTKLCMI